MRAQGRQQDNDPDVEALLAAHPGLDAYAIIRRRAGELLARFEEFEDDSPTPLERVKALASVQGLPVREAAEAMPNGRVAMFVPSGRSGYIVYDPNLPAGRVLFSIAHEIVHSFVPATRSGVRFRSTYSPASRPGRQLEMLCEFGAALLVMPDAAFAASLLRHGFGLASVDAVRRQFGTSFEATTYRMAQVAPFPAAAVKLHHRLSKAQLQQPPASGHLFPRPSPDIARPKYRCQSFHPSPSFPGRIPFNKSFNEESCVYGVSLPGPIVSAVEAVPTAGRAFRCRVEAMAAPYQRPEAGADRPDVLVLVRASRAAAAVHRGAKATDGSVPRRRTRPIDGVPDSAAASPTRASWRSANWLRRRPSRRPRPACRCPRPQAAAWRARPVPPSRRARGSPAPARPAAGVT
jgi:Zn-dependent peptidase ImmA (M78 family)